MLLQIVFLYSDEIQKVEAVLIVCSYDSVFDSLCCNFSFDENQLFVVHIHYVLTKRVSNLDKNNILLNFQKPYALPAWL